MLIVKFSEKYSVSELKDKLVNYLDDKITAPNVCEFAKYAAQANALTLKKRCLEYFPACLSKNKFVPNMEVLDKTFLIAAIKILLAIHVKLFNLI
uniref:Uncharacterized protein n=1 Tax=Panagrolaimus davidi TaxID=227884 RepID=A0A914QHZ4_9BILA